MNRFLALGAFFVITVSAAGDPRRDLRSDVKNLNVRYATEHYALAGTTSDAKLENYGEALEYVYREYAMGFGELFDQQEADASKDADKRFNVVILATADEYTEFAKAYFRDGMEHSTGLFAASASLLIIRDGGDRENTYGTLFHEAFHQFAHRYILAIPTWLNEGLATYYGTARPGRSGLAFNRPRSDLFRLVRNAATNRKLIPLRELMESSQAAFYDQTPIDGLGCSHKTLCYAQSYTLASYMINDREGREHLRSYLRKLSSVKTSDDARQVTSAVFTDELLDAMVTPWIAHVNRR